MVPNFLTCSILATRYHSLALRLLAPIDRRKKREILPASMQIINPSYLQAENGTILFSLVEFTINSSN